MCEVKLGHLTKKKRMAHLKIHSLQSNVICERFHKTLQDECYNPLFRKKPYHYLEELQSDSGEYTIGTGLAQGAAHYEKTPWDTFQQCGHLALEKDMSRGGDQSDNTTLQLSAVR